MLRKLLPLSATALLACATGSSTTTEGGIVPVSERTQQRIQNLSHFDLANCNPSPPELIGPPTKPGLTGLLVSAQSLVNECLVDPESRADADETTVEVTSTVGKEGIEHAVTGANLTASGERCIQRTLEDWFAKAKVDGSSLEEPVSGSFSLTHHVDRSPAVTFGVNEASDIVGLVRLAQPEWCECYEPWTDTPPRSMRAWLKIVKPTETPEGDEAPPETTTPEWVAFTQQPPEVDEDARDGEAAAPADDEAPDEATEQIRGCLREKLMALEFRPVSGELTVPYLFEHVNSNVSEPLPDAEPYVQFQQYDLLRARQNAETAIAIGSREPAAVQYEWRVQWYQNRVKQKKNRFSDIDKLTGDCNALLAADDRVIEVLGRQKALEQEILTFVENEAAENPQWTDAATKLQEQSERIDEEITAWQGYRENDQAACPKVSYK